MFNALLIETHNFIELCRVSRCHIIYLQLYDTHNERRIHIAHSCISHCECLSICAQVSMCALATLFSLLPMFMLNNFGYKSVLIERYQAIAEITVNECEPSVSYTKYKKTHNINEYTRTLSQAETYIKRNSLL